MARSEKFTRPPHSAHVGSGQRKPTMMDRQIAMMRGMKEEEDARITNEEELKRELFDFSYLTETDEYGFPHQTKYQIPDSMPDVYAPASPEKVSEKAKTDEVTTSDSGAPQPE